MTQSQNATNGQSRLDTDNFYVEVAASGLVQIENPLTVTDDAATIEGDVGNVSAFLSEEFESIQEFAKFVEPLGGEFNIRSVHSDLLLNLLEKIDSSTIESLDINDWELRLYFKEDDGGESLYQLLDYLASDKSEQHRKPNSSLSDSELLSHLVELPRHSICPDEAVHDLLVKVASYTDSPDIQIDAECVSSSIDGNDSSIALDWSVTNSTQG